MFVQNVEVYLYSTVLVQNFELYHYSYLTWETIIIIFTVLFVCFFYLETALTSKAKLPYESNVHLTAAGNHRLDDYG